jgi:hypothetical protein
MSLVHATCTRKYKIHTFLVETFNERDNLGDAGTDGSAISKWILE